MNYFKYFILLKMSFADELPAEINKSEKSMRILVSDLDSQMFNNNLLNLTKSDSGLIGKDILDET